MSMQEATTRVTLRRPVVILRQDVWRLVKRHIKKAITHMDVRDTDVVLDVGIGTGASLHFYPSNGQIIGIDLSGGMLRECRKKIREQHRTNVMVLQGDALDLPFAEDSFDHVFISHVISVVSDRFY